MDIQKGRKEKKKKKQLSTFHIGTCGIILFRRGYTEGRSILNGMRDKYQQADQTEQTVSKVWPFWSRRNYKNHPEAISADGNPLPSPAFVNTNLQKKTTRQLMLISNHTMIGHILQLMDHWPKAKCLIKPRPTCLIKPLPSSFQILGPVKATSSQFNYNDNIMYIWYSPANMEPSDTTMLVWCVL